MNPDPCKDFFKAPRLLEGNERPRDPAIMYLYRGLREILNITPYMIKTAYNNNARLDRVDRAQDMIAEAIDKCENVTHRIRKIVEKKETKKKVSDAYTIDETFINDPFCYRIP